MEFNENILHEIIRNQESQKPIYVLYVGEKSFTFEDVNLFKSATPLTKPNTRGGVYFSNINIFKIKGVINDLSIIPLLSKSMLGPNSQFQDLQIKTTLLKNAKSKEITIIANLTNSFQTSNHLELSMTIVGANTCQ